MLNYGFTTYGIDDDIIFSSHTESERFEVSFFLAFPYSCFDLMIRTAMCLRVGVRVVEIERAKLRTEFCGDLSGNLLLTCYCSIDSSRSLEFQLTKLCFLGLTLTVRGRDEWWGGFESVSSFLKLKVIN